MNRKFKRIISYILCLTLILGIDSFSSFYNHRNITMGANKNSGTEETGISGEDTEETAHEEKSGKTDNNIKEGGTAGIDGAETETTKKKKKKKKSKQTDAAEPETKEPAAEEPETAQPDIAEPETMAENVDDNGDVHDINNDEMSGYAAGSEGIKLTDATELKAGEKYLITSYDDWTKLSQISQTSTLEGMEFIVYKRQSKYDDWTLNNIKVGCKEYPFSGTLYNYYSTTTIYTNTIIFDYLSSKAHIGTRDRGGVKTFVLYYTGNVPAGLANNLVLDKAGCEVNIGESGTSNYYVKILAGTIVSSAEAGGLFANVYVEDEAVSPDGAGNSIYKINVSGNGIDLTRTNEKNKGVQSVSGRVAGGLIGSIRGDIDVNVISWSAQIPSVSSSATSAGSFIGSVSDGVKISFNNEAEVIMSANVSGKGYVGGLIGYIGNSDFICDKGIRRAGNTSGTSHTGGLLGYAFNSSCVIANYTQNNNTYIYQTANGANNANLSAGGVIGKYYNNNTEGNDVLDISYIKTQNKDAAVYSGIKITAANLSYNKVGGVAGIIESGNANVHIHDINTDTETKGENSFNTNMVYYGNSSNISTNNETGGLAGVLAGSNILIENIVFNYVYNSGNSARNSNTLAGSVIGDIAARVGYIDNYYSPSRLVIKDIKVVKSFVKYANAYHGGLFGFVGQSAVAMQGNIDLSGVPYKTYANSQRESYDHTLQATLHNRGFVAGYAEGSLIYIDAGCNYNRPVTYGEDGIIKEFNANKILYYDNDAITSAEHRYCIDDIGNHGSVFRNVENILDITRDISQIVTGSIDREADKYVIDTLGDALRLAIAGDTVISGGYPVFGGNCFAGEGEPIALLADILSKNFVIKTDLNLQDAGIHGFVRNDNVTDYPFTGVFEGQKGSEGQNPVITIDFISRQRYGGLFPYAKNAAFKNLDIKGNIFYTCGDANVSGAGSLSAYAKGNITADKVNIYTNMKCSINSKTQWDDSNRWSYGGVFGVYTPDDDTGNGTYECNNCVIAPNFTTIRSNAHVGGMIGWVQMGNLYRLQKMSINGCTLSAQITSDEVYTWRCGTSNVHGREAGLISMISDSYHNVGYTSNNWNVPVSVSNNTYGNIDITDMKISGANIDLTKTNATNNDVKISGGFLGYAWCNVDVNINNLSIDDSVFNSRGCVGGLISYAAGRYNLTGININSLAMKHVDNQYFNTYTYCGFLIGNGQNAYVTVKDYNIADGGKVTYQRYSNFDEIVGLNLRLRNGGEVDYIWRPSYPVDEKYINGGIVNIIDDEFSPFNEGTYKSYVNKVVKETNKYTRYYYNLFTEGKDWNVPASGGICTVGTPEQWMTFHVASYASGNLARYFTPYFNNAAISSVKSIQITDDLDMNGYSLYPTPLTDGATVDGGGHTITLYGEELSDLEKGIKEKGIHEIFRNNELSSTQHYMMHASLFNEVKNSSKIRNMTLTGTAANIGANAGALVSGAVYGSVEIKSITLKDLKIGHYKDAGCGLLVSHIGTDNLNNNIASNVTFDGIKSEYSSYDGLPAGAALIGYVGKSDANNIKVTFRNIQVEDEKTDDKKSGKLFKYASYVYNYRYTDNLDVNRCYMLYTFTEQDCLSGNVTFGDEIKDGVQYLDKDRSAGDTLDIAIDAAKDGAYIPYVFTERNIFVNPRNGNITEGCGTYEDPYKITNAKQFLTLYLYLTGKPEYNTMFVGTGTSDDSAGVWKVVPIGGDGNGAECSGDAHLAVSYGTQNFPTRDDLRTAYYKICADIQLNSKEDLNDKYIGSEFSGLGSSEYPFAGVIIGTNGSGNYTVTLPKQSQKRVVSDGKVVYNQIEQSTVGLISYMGGGVVKDINVAGDDWEHSYYNITDCAGGIAARIVGGDNIIDNVKVSVNLNIHNPHIQADGTGGIKGLGGLVGAVDNGSLILRNIQDGKIVQNCLFQGTDNSGTGDYKGDYNELAGMLVGKVYDGFVIYEGYRHSGTGDEPKVLKRKELQVSDRYTDKYPLVNGFHIINANVLDKASEDKRLTFSKSGNEYNALIKNGVQLEIMALALNSDAFSVFYCERNDHSTGYGYKAKCRRAMYDDVGKLSSADRELAVAYDDNKLNDIGYLYPYICYKYIDYTLLSGAGDTAYTDPSFGINNYEGYKATLSNVTRTEKVNNKDVEVTNIISNVNKAISDVAEYTTTYELESKADEPDKMFDVSGYDMSFRGIGAIYTKSYSDFRANFNGNGNYVRFYINRSFDKNIKYSGMFNELIYNQKVIDKNTSDRQLEIRDFTIKNSIVYNPNKDYYLENDARANYEIQYSGRGTNSCATGGVAGDVKGAWLFKNITLTRDEDIADNKVESDVSGYKCVGGLIGRISNTIATDGYPSVNYMQQNFPKSNDIDIVNCNIMGNGDTDVKVTELGSTVGITWACYRLSFAGGLVGGIGTNLMSGNNKGFLYGNVDFKCCSIDRLTITAENKGCLGGFAGMIGVRWNTDTDNDSGWGAIGSVNVDGNGDGTGSGKISNLNIISKNIAEDYSAGGIFGRIDGLACQGYGGAITVHNYQFEDINIDTNPVDKGSSGSNKEGIGGVIGYTRSCLTDLRNIKISGKNVIGNAYTNKYSGGLIGTTRPTGNNNTSYYQHKKLNTLNINDCSVEGINIGTKGYSCGGFVGKAYIETINIGGGDSSNSINNCNIKTGSGSAGGIAGYIYGDNLIGHGTSNQSVTANVYNVDAHSINVCSERGSAGGIIGLADVPDREPQSSVNLKNIVVYGTEQKNTEIISSLYSGGIIGNSSDIWVHMNMEGYMGVGVKHDADGWVEADKNCVNIRGQYSGGLIGYKYTAYGGEDYKADILINASRIYSYINNNDNQPETYSGGLFGRLQIYNNPNIKIRFNNVSVKNNIIFTGANNKPARNSGNVGAGCGGIAGYLHNNSEASTYMPYVTLENNSIGCYSPDDTADKDEGWKTVTCESKDVKLYHYDQTAGSVKTVSYDKIENLGDDNIGNYALAFGQFIGRMYAPVYSSQIFILNPQVTTAETLGSIPVIDVGSNTWTKTGDQSTVTYGECAPYMYRKNCHIVYIDAPDGNYNNIDNIAAGRKPYYIDTSLLEGGSKEYQFGNFKDIVETYQNLNSGVSDTATKNYNYIMSKRLNMYMPYNDENVKYSLCKGDNSYYNLTYNLLNDEGLSENIINGVPVLVLDGLKAQSVGDYAAAILTNGGGVVSESVVKPQTNVKNTSMNNFWSISCKNAYIDTDGSIKPIDTSLPEFSGHKVSSIYTTDSNRLNLAQSLYDEFIQRPGQTGLIYTITLLCYKYTCPGAEGTRTETIYIPVFVKEKVTMNSYIRILPESVRLNVSVH